VEPKARNLILEVAPAMKDFELFEAPNFTLKKGCALPITRFAYKAVGQLLVVMCVLGPLRAGAQTATNLAVLKGFRSAEDL
jgi:hypothetical protein